MKNLSNINELLILAGAVAMGTIAYFGFVVSRRNQKLTIKYAICVYAVNLFLTHQFFALLVILNFNKYREMMPMAAYVSQYFIDWLDKRFPQLFDALVKRNGVDLNNSTNEQHNDNPEPKP